MTPINSRQNHLIETLKIYKTRRLEKNLTEPQQLNGIIDRAIKELSANQIAIDSLEKIRDHIKGLRAKGRLHIPGYPIEVNQLGFPFLGRVLKEVEEYLNINNLKKAT